MLKVVEQIDPFDEISAQIVGVYQKMNRMDEQFMLFLEQQKNIIEQCNKISDVRTNNFGVIQKSQFHHEEKSDLFPNFAPKSFATTSKGVWGCPPWSTSSPTPRSTTTDILKTYDEIDAFAEMQRQAEECNLIDLSDPSPDNGENSDNDDHDDGGGNETSSPNELGGGAAADSGGAQQWESLSAGWTCPSMAMSADAAVLSTFRPDKLPRQAIIYDYTTQPIGAIEHKRAFMPPAQPDGRALLSYPFLRPLFLDGVGLIKAYRACCTENNELPGQSHPYELYFPLMPIVRCLFYWISRGHRTILCFSQQFSPLGDEIFQATREDRRSLNEIEENGMAQFFMHSNSKEWFDRKSEKTHGCLVTTVPHYLKGMPHDLRYFMQDNDQRPWDHCCERLLQPFYDHKGNTVFFSLYNSKNQCVDSVVLMDDVQSNEQFEELNRNQLSFMEQVLQLKVLYNLLPKDARFRERNLMVEVFKRLKPFL